MNKFEVDYTELDSKLNQPKTFKYSDVKDQLVKVAFDIVRFFDSSDIEGLWQIQKDKDGEYIVALYEDKAEALQKEASAKNYWNVIVNKNEAHLFYKGIPIKKMAAQELGIPPNEIHLIKQYLPQKLANNSKLVREVLSLLSESERNNILQQFPELN